MKSNRFVFSKAYTRIVRLSTVRFMIVGGINTTVDFAVLNILVLVGFTRSFFLFGQEFLVAVPLGILAAMVNSFLWNRVWVFSDTNQRGKTIRQVVLFVIVTIISVFIIQQILVNVLYYNVFTSGNTLFLNLTESIAAFVPFDIGSTLTLLNLAKLIATVASITINFLSYRYIVFSR